MIPEIDREKSREGHLKHKDGKRNQKDGKICASHLNNYITNESSEVRKLGSAEVKKMERLKFTSELLRLYTKIVSVYKLLFFIFVMPEVSNRASRS